MSRWRLIGFGIAAYAIGLIAAAPATLLDGRLERVSAGALRLAEARGTLWSGQGQIEIRDANRRSGVATQVAWEVRPAHLLRGKLLYEVELGGSAKHFPVTLSLEGIDISRAEISLPAAALGMGMPRLAPLGLTGELLLRISRLSLGGGAVRGNATLQWRAAGSAFSPVSPFGGYELRLEADGKAARASLRTLQGPLQLDGQGSWARGRRPILTATARIAPQYRQQFAPLLRMIAVERSDGSFTLQ